jgi:Transposase IS116/IS110/IS902 family
MCLGPQAAKKGCGHVRPTGRHNAHSPPPDQRAWDLHLADRPAARGSSRRSRLTALIHKASNGHHGQPRAEAWLSVARQAVELYGDDPAVAFEDLAAEMASEARLWRATEAEHRQHAKAREQAYRIVDPAGLARSLPGVGTTGGPVIVATMGRPGRFPNPDAFKAFTGLTPRASQTGVSDRKGQAMTKAGPRGCAVSWCSRRTRPARSTRSWRRCIGPRWSSGVRITPRPSVSSRPGWPLEHTWSWPAVSRT